MLRGKIDACQEDTQAELWEKILLNSRLPAAQLSPDIEATYKGRSECSSDAVMASTDSPTQSPSSGLNNKEPPLKQGRLVTRNGGV